MKTGKDLINYLSNKTGKGERGKNTEAGEAGMGTTPGGNRVISSSILYEVISIILSFLIN